jgi:sarcosine oxidase delta subunit
MFSNKKKIKCPYCGTLRQFEEFDTTEILERHALAEHGFKLPCE